MRHSFEQGRKTKGAEFTVNPGDSGILLTDMDVGNAGVAGAVHLALAPERHLRRRAHPYA